MDTDERGTLSPDDSRDADPSAERWRRLSERLGSEVDRARAGAAAAYAERDRIDALYRDALERHKDARIASLVAERDRQTAELGLARATAYVERTLPVIRTMRALLASMQNSKFWKLRNAWFGFKQRARLNPSGPQPYWVPDADVAETGWDEELPYERWLLANRVRPADVDRMRDTIRLLIARPVFSVLMPAYDTPEPMLREAIESVLAQPYPDWQLCIADDASRAPHVRRVLEEYAAADDRIRVVFRETNGRIAAASNSALALASGEFVALLDHDDLLAPDALFENALVVNRRPDVDLIYSDEDKIDEHGRRREPYFKPDWSPESVLARNYVSHLGVYRRELVERIGGFREGYEGSQDYDLLLRFTELTEKIEHIPRVLYHWRVHAGSTAAARDQKDFAHDAALRALNDALGRRGEAGTVAHSGVAPGTYTVRYAIARPERVSIIMPTRDHGADVDLALRTVFERSTYPDFEVILLDNGSRDAASLRTFGRWAAAEPKRLRIVPYDVPFNFPRINNYAVGHTTGAYLLFLNNDTEVVTPDWIEAMVEQAQRPPIGCVGAKLLYPDDTVQHAGVVVGLGGVAGHSHKYYPANAPGYFYTLQTTNNYSAVTAACMMMRRDVFDRAGGFDESLAIAFNDVDLCLRVRGAGYRNVYLPHVVLYHHESKSRGYEDTAEKLARFAEEQKTMIARWRTADACDPYYNPNLTRMTEDYAIRP